MKQLILLTSEFPFGSGETFLENEISYLASEFDKVTIISTCDDDVQTRNVPSNVKVVRRTTSRNKYRSILNILNPVYLEERKVVNRILDKSNDQVITKVQLKTLQQAQEHRDFIYSMLEIERVNPGDLVLYSYWLDEKALALSLIKKDFPSVRAISRAHGWDVYFERHPQDYLPYRQFMFENLDKVFFVSENGIHYTRSLFKEIDHKKLALGRLGTIQTMPYKLKYNSDKLVLYSCSNIIPLKRIHLIIQAISKIEGTPVEWVHVGSGPLNDELLGLATSLLAGKPNVKFTFKGQISNSELIAIYASTTIDLFINVSETEGLPVSIMEAFSFGIPALAPEVGGIPEIVNDDVNGFLMSKDPTPVEVADKLDHFHALDESSRIDLMEKARETWETNFNAGKNYPKFIEDIW